MTPIENARVEGEEAEVEEFNSFDLVGELEPGQHGYVVLDAEGNPSAATLEAPEPGIPFARVFRPAKPHDEQLLTNAGAPVIPPMQPDPFFDRDAQMGDPARTTKIVEDMAETDEETVDTSKK